MAKSIFGLELDELKAILETDKLPEDVDLEGMAVRPDFNKVFNLRSNPSKLASYLLAQKGYKGSTGGTTSVQKHEYVGVIPEEMRRERLDLKRRELDIKTKKLEQNTTVLNKIEEMLIALNALNKRVSAIELVLKRLVALQIEKDK